MRYNGRRPLRYLVLGPVFGNGYAINLSSVFKYFSIDMYVTKEHAKQLLRLKGHHIQDDASIRAIP